MIDLLFWALLGLGLALWGWVLGVEARQEREVLALLAQRGPLPAEKIWALLPRYSAREVQTTLYRLHRAARLVSHSTGGGQTLYSLPRRGGRHAS